MRATLKASTVTAAATAPRAPRYELRQVAFRRHGAHRVLLPAADALSSLGLTRQQAIWRVQGLYDGSTPLFAGQDSGGPPVRFQAMSTAEQVRADYASTGLSVDLHPTVLVRRELDRQRVLRARDLASTPAKRRVRVGGLVISRQHPDTKTGMIFLALEDETGLVNVSVPRRVYERHRTTIHRAVFLWVDGTLERDGRALNVMARRLGDLAAEAVAVKSRDFR